MQVIGNMYDHLQVAKNKTVNIIDQLDKKIKSKGKPIDSKTKEVFITKKEC